MRYFLSLSGLACLLFLSSCGGGGSSSGPAPANPVQTGVFVDSPVMGLRYETPSQSGLTNTSGEYQYLSGETVTFSLGGITLGSAIGRNQITPLDLIGATSFDDANERGLTDHLTNLLVFLQSLDRDHNPDNGIDLTDLDEALVDEELNFDTVSIEFLQSAYKRIVNEQKGFYQNIKRANNHFLTTLDTTASVRLPLQDEVDKDGDGETDSTIRYTYDDNGNLIEAIESSAGGIQLNRSTMDYDPYGQLTSIIFEELDPQILIFTRTYEYDSFGRVISELDEDESFADNIARRVTREYDEAGNQTGMLSVQNQTNLNLKQPHSAFDTFFIFPEYNPKEASIVVFPPFPTGITGYSKGEENIIIETTVTFGDDGELTEKEETFEYQKTNSETGPWQLKGQSTSYQQGKPSNFSAQITWGEPYPSGTTSIITEYSFSEAGDVIGCNVTSAGSLFGEKTLARNFEVSGKNDDIYCDSSLARQTQKIFDDQSQIIGIEVSEWGDIIASPLIEIEDSRTRIENHEFDYNESGQVTEALKTITQKFSLSSSIVTTIGTHKIVYSYTASGELKSRHDYLNDELKYSQTRTFQTLELEKLP